MKVLLAMIIVILIATIIVLLVSFKGALEIINALDEILKNQEGEK